MRVDGVSGTRRPIQGCAKGVLSTVWTLKAAVLVTAFALISMFSFAPDASAGSCSSGGSGDSPPEGRPYRAGAEQHPPEVRKYLALTTNNADGVPDRCDCTAPRDWDWGLDAAAIASAKAAMDGKEALAIHNYAKYGVPAEQVPMEARTIWFRTTWRNNAEQVCLRSVFGSGAAIPGTSKHEWGMAVDLEDGGRRTPAWTPGSCGPTDGAPRCRPNLGTTRSPPRRSAKAGRRHQRRIALPACGSRSAACGSRPVGSLPNERLERAGSLFTRWAVT